MKQLPKKDPPEVGGGLAGTIGIPCTDPPLVPGRMPFPTEFPGGFPGGPDGPTFPNEPPTL